MEGSWGLILIVGIGLGGLAFLMLMFLVRRWVRRQQQTIERGRDQRREMRSAGRVDAWQAGADRYIDEDKLPEGGNADEADAWPEDGADLDEDEAPGFGTPMTEEQDEERDPYRLFEDMPYQESDEDDAEEDEDEEGEDWEGEGGR